jgi:hypothetical protein
LPTTRVSHLRPAQSQRSALTAIGDFSARSLARGDGRLAAESPQ